MSSRETSTRRSGQAARSAALAFTVLALGACTEPVELSDWTLPVPEGTRVIEHEVLPLEERRPTLCGLDPRSSDVSC
jgi:hypothetical protein